MKKKVLFIIPIIILAAIACIVLMARTPGPVDPTQPTTTTPTTPTTPRPTTPTDSNPTEPTDPASPTEPTIPGVGQLTEEYVRNYPATPLSDFTYEEKDDGYGNEYVIITGYIGNDCIVHIPATINGKPVTIADGVLGFNSGIRGVLFPETIRTLSYTFMNNLDIEVVIGESVASLYGNTFVGCSNLRVVVLSEELWLISSNEFLGCSNLEYLYLPETLVQVACLEGNEPMVFQGCDKLTIYGKEGSFIQGFCAEYNIPFEVVD